MWLGLESFGGTWEIAVSGMLALVPLEWGNGTWSTRSLARCTRHFRDQLEVEFEQYRNC